MIFGNGKIFLVFCPKAESGVFIILRMGIANRHLSVKEFRKEFSFGNKGT